MLTIKPVELISDDQMKIIFDVFSEVFPDYLEDVAMKEARKFVEQIMRFKKEYKAFIEAATDVCRIMTDKSNEKFINYMLYMLMNDLTRDIKELYMSRIVPEKGNHYDFLNGFCGDFFKPERRIKDMALKYVKNLAESREKQYKEYNDANTINKYFGADKIYRELNQKEPIVEEDNGGKYEKTEE